MLPIDPGSTLRWTQPSARSSMHELRTDDDLVATLDFRGGRASAVSASGSWTIERDVTRTIRIWNVATRTLVGELSKGSWTGRRTLLMADGRLLIWKPASFLHMAWRFRADAGTALGFRRGRGIIRADGVLEVGHAVTASIDLEVLAILARYLVLVLRTGTTRWRRSPVRSPPCDAVADRRNRLGGPSHREPLPVEQAIRTRAGSGQARSPHPEVHPCELAGSRPARYLLALAGLAALAAAGGYAFLVATTANQPGPAALPSAPSGSPVAFSATDPDGTWVIDPDGSSFVGYRAKELLAVDFVASPNEAVGRTSDVTGVHRDRRWQAREWRDHGPGADPRAMKSFETHMSSRVCSSMRTRRRRSTCVGPSISRASREGVARA